MSADTTTYKNYSDQFRECKAAGLTKPGEMFTETAVRYYVSDGQDGVMCKRGPLEITSQKIVCGKFGGDCFSGNAGCQKLRNVPPEIMSNLKTVNWDDEG